MVARLVRSVHGRFEVPNGLVQDRRAGAAEAKTLLAELGRRQASVVGEVARGALAPVAEDVDGEGAAVQHELMHQCRPFDADQDQERLE